MKGNFDKIKLLSSKKKEFCTVRVLSEWSTTYCHPYEYAQTVTHFVFPKSTPKKFQRGNGIKSHKTIFCTVGLLRTKCWLQVVSGDIQIKYMWLRDAFRLKLELEQCVQAMRDTELRQQDEDKLAEFNSNAKRIQTELEKAQAEETEAAKRIRCSWPSTEATQERARSSRRPGSRVRGRARDLTCGGRTCHIRKVPY